jgi:Relaxase/Mobilisation nuclease domain
VIAMSSSARSFGALARYLATGRSGDHPERVAWSTSRNLPTDDPELAGKIMRATAAQNVRAQQPVYHLALSFDPKDAVDRVAMERVADRVLAALDLQRHQVLIVSHRDREHPHVHLLINRVHPDTGLVWNRWQDRAVVQQVLRDEERALGLRIVPGRLASVDSTTSKHVVAATRETLDAKHEVPAPLGPSNPDASIERIRPGRVVEVAKHLQSYERVEELSHERYRIEVDATASRTRLAQLEYTAERASRVYEEFDRALARVYREPRLARDGFMAAAEQHGIAEATHLMHERPEQFGALTDERKTRIFGLTPATDDTRARAARTLT